MRNCPCQKKDGRAWTRALFFWYDIDFSLFKKKKQKKNSNKFKKKSKKSVSYEKKGFSFCPSFGMTTTQAIRDLIWHLSLLPSCLHSVLAPSHSSPGLEPAGQSEKKQVTVNRLGCVKDP